MNRLSPIERSQLPEAQRRFYDAVQAIRRRPISGPFIVTMNSSPDLAARFAHLGHYFHSRGQADESILSLRVRTFVALVGSRALDVPYEWSAWVGWALEAGVPQATVDAIRERQPLKQLTPEETLVLTVCTQLVTGDHKLSDATYRAARKHFGAQGVVELVVSLGYFAMIAFPLNAFEIEMSAEQKALRKPYAPLVVAAHTEQIERRSAAPPPFAQREGMPARIPLLKTHADLKAADQHFFDRIVRTRGHIAGLYQVLLHTPDVADRMATVGAFFLYEGVLSPSIRALVGLITARELDCAYVWAACASEARTADVPQSMIDTIASGATPLDLSDEQALVFAFCWQLLRGNHHVNEVTYRATAAHFGVPATVQIAATLGYCAMMALVANAFDIAPQADQSAPAL